MYAKLFRNMTQSYLPRRASSHYIKEQHRSHPAISNIYEQLLNASRSSVIPCNFVSQIMDCWAKNTDSTALRCIDLDKDVHHYRDMSYADLEKDSHQI